MINFSQIRKQLVPRFWLVFGVVAVVLPAILVLVLVVFFPALKLPAVPPLLSQAQLEKESYKLQEVITQSHFSLSASPTLTASTAPLDVAYSPDGSLVAFSYRQGLVLICEVATGKKVSEIPVMLSPYKPDSSGTDYFQYPTRIKFSPDSKYLARYGGGLANIYSNPVEIYEVVSSKLVSSLRSTVNATEVAFNTHAPILAARTGNQELTLLKLGQSQPFAYIRNTPKPVVDAPGQAGRGSYTREDHSGNLFSEFKFISENRLAVLVSVCQADSATAFPCHYNWGIIKINSDGYELLQDLNSDRFSGYTWFLGDNGQDIFLTNPRGATPRKIVMLNGRDATITNSITPSFTAEITEKSFSSDGKLVTLFRDFGNQSGILVYTTEKGRLLAEFITGEPVNHLQFMPDKLQLTGISISGKSPLKYRNFILTASS